MELCRAYGIQKSQTTPYHPQGNAYVERVHFFWRNAISTFIRGDQLIWDEMIPELTLCWNNAVSEATGVAPNESVFGRMLNTVNAPEQVTVKQKLTLMQDAERIKYIINRARYLINEGIVKKLQRNDKLSDGVQTTLFSDGQKVKLFAPKKLEGNSVKLSQGFYGPYFIESSRNDGKVYYLKDMLGEVLPFPVSVLRLEAWNDRKDIMQGLVNEDESQEDDSTPNTPFEGSDSEDSGFEDEPKQYAREMTSPWEDNKADFTLEESDIESEKLADDFQKNAQESPKQNMDSGEQDSDHSDVLENLEATRLQPIRLGKTKHYRDAYDRRLAQRLPVANARKTTRAGQRAILY